MKINSGEWTKAIVYWIWKSFHHGTNVIKSETGSGELETSNGNLGEMKKWEQNPTGTLALSGLPVT